MPVKVRWMNQVWRVGIFRILGGQDGNGWVVIRCITCWVHIDIYPPGNQHIPPKWHFEDDFPFPKVGYVSSLEGRYTLLKYDFGLMIIWSYIFLYFNVTIFTVIHITPEVERLYLNSVKTIVVVRVCNQQLQRTIYPFNGQWLPGYLPEQSKKHLVV